jgi:phospholipid-binding lipoprotein MlaA
VRWGSLALSYVDNRARLLSLDKTLSETYDPYAFIRESYLQHRRYLVYDGNPPEEPISEDPGEDAPSPPR